jgi:chromosome segregation ATPase
MSQDMKREIDGLKARATRYEADVRAFFATVRDIQSDLRAMKSDLSELPGMKKDIQSIKETLRRVAVRAAQTGGDLTELKTYVHGNLVTKGEFRTQMDGFAGRIDDFRLHMAQQKERLDDLESKSKHS